VVDQTGAATFWHLQSQALTNSNIAFTDNSGAQRMSLWSAQSGGVYEKAIFAADIEPSGSRTIGTSSNRWALVYGTTVDALTLQINGLQKINTSGWVGTLAPAIPSTYDIGASSNRWANVYVVNLDISGTCTGCTTGGTFVTTNTSQTITGQKTFSQSILFTSPVDIGTSGARANTVYALNFDAAPSGGIGNYAAARKYNIVDTSGGSGFWDMQAQASPGGSSSFTLRSNTGFTVMQLIQTSFGSSVRSAKIDGTLSSTIDGGFDLGAPGGQWQNLYIFGGIRINGTPGLNSILNCPAGQAVKYLQIAGGVILNGNCGAI
jgi:hypothetical protein